MDVDRIISISDQVDIDAAELTAAVKSFDVVRVHQLLEQGALRVGTTSAVLLQLANVFTQIDYHFRNAIFFEERVTSFTHLCDPVTYPISRCHNVKCNDALLTQAERIIHALLSYLPLADDMFSWRWMHTLAQQYPPYASRFRVGRATHDARMYAINKSWDGATGPYQQQQAPNNQGGGCCSWSNLLFRMGSCLRCCGLWWWDFCCATAPDRTRIGSRAMTFSDFTANQMQSWWQTKATPETILHAHQNIILRRTQLCATILQFLETQCIPPLAHLVLDFLQEDIARWVAQNYAADVAGLLQMPTE